MWEENAVWKEPDIIEKESDSVREEKTPERAEETPRNMRKKFSFFGPATMLYAAFYAFCMYRNGSGITFPFFLAGSFLYFIFSMKKLGITLKKGSGFYMGTMMLLAISTFCTDDGRIIALNKTGIFLLMISLLLNQFYHTEKWGLGKYLLSILHLLFYCIWELPRPISDGKEYFKTHPRKDGKRVYYVLLGFVITVPIFLVVLALLSSADAVFRQVIEKPLSVIRFDNIFGVAFRVGFWYFAVYMILASLCRGSMKEEVKDHRNGEPLLAITVTGMLSLLYLLFSGIQILYLFLGNMKLPGGYTYAEYAREGFFQLLAVSILNLIIVLFCMAFFRESKVLKIILTVMSLCTFVMIASSALRMIIYIRYYYLTFLRILVLWSLAVLFLLFLGVVAQIYRASFPLFRYGVTVVSIFYLALSFSHPDYWIAKVNTANAPQSMEMAVAFWNGQGEWSVSEGDFFQSEKPYQDYRYLGNLCMDAAPVLIPYLESLGYKFQALDGMPGKTAGTEGGGAPGASEYWDAVEFYTGYTGQRNGGEGIPEKYGYRYLEKYPEKVRDKAEDMSVRSFNLSRYIALRLVQRIM